ncbi:MAG: hypothetical protein D6816_13040 [Bacteroidetes bacterium]|nr:MAG: hypothetical protein D6816_13040 [Bacteroidota bacterium]
MNKQFLFGVVAGFFLARFLGRRGGYDGSGILPQMPPLTDAQPPIKQPPVKQPPIKQAQTSPTLDATAGPAVGVMPRAACPAPFGHIVQHQTA